MRGWKWEEGKRKGRDREEAGRWSLLGRACALGWNFQSEWRKRRPRAPSFSGLSRVKFNATGGSSSPAAARVEGFRRQNWAKRRAEKGKPVQGATLCDGARYSWRPLDCRTVAAENSERAEVGPTALCPRLRKNTHAISNARLPDHGAARRTGAKGRATWTLDLTSKRRACSACHVCQVSRQNAGVASCSRRTARPTMPSRGDGCIGCDELAAAFRVDSQTDLVVPDGAAAV